MNKVIHGDCLDVMKDIPDKSIDLVLTDPPYGIDEAGGKNKNRVHLATPKDYGELDWDKSIPKKEYFNEIFRISKNQIIFGGNYFIENLKNTSCFIIWDKKNYGSDFADCEIAWTSFNSAVRLFKYQWNGMLQENMKKKEIRYHPTQKPVELFSWCLEKYSKEGMTILDPFAGSGTTAISCIRLNRNYILIEKEKKYIDIINKRISQEKDGNLFEYEKQLELIK